MTPQMGYYGSQDEFRNAVMYEYRFEVLGEGKMSTIIEEEGLTTF